MNGRFSPQDSGCQTSSYHLYALRFKTITETQRNEIIQKMAEKTISVNDVPMLTLFKELGYDIKNYPISYDTYLREVSLPIYSQACERAGRLCNRFFGAGLRRSSVEGNISKPLKFVRLIQKS